MLCEMPVACSMLGMWTTHMPTANPLRPKYSPGGDAGGSGRCGLRTQIGAVYSGHLDQYSALGEHGSLVLRGVGSVMIRSGRSAGQT